MGAAITGSGNKELALLGLRLKAAADGGLRRELLAGLRSAARPLIGDVQAAARAQLPRRGGLNEYVAASKFTVRNSLSPASAAVRIVNQPVKTTSRRGSGSVQFGSDKGVVRHPVFGHMDRWSATAVTPGWFSKTIEDRLPDVTGEVRAVVATVAAKLAGG